MIIVREFFVAKPGQASKLAKLMREVLTMSQQKGVVMTDAVGTFNHVVMESEYENFEALQRRMADYESNPAVREKMKGYTDLWLTGGREIYQVVN